MNHRRGQEQLAARVRLARRRLILAASAAEARITSQVEIYTFTCWQAAVSQEWVVSTVGLEGILARQCAASARISSLTDKAQASAKTAEAASVRLRASLDLASRAAKSCQAACERWRIEVDAVAGVARNLPANPPHALPPDDSMDRLATRAVRSVRHAAIAVEELQAAVAAARADADEAMPVNFASGWNHAHVALRANARQSIEGFHSGSNLAKCAVSAELAAQGRAFQVWKDIFDSDECIRVARQGLYQLEEQHALHPQLHWQSHRGQHRDHHDHHDHRAGFMGRYLLSTPLGREPVSGQGTPGLPARVRFFLVPTPVANDFSMKDADEALNRESVPIRVETVAQGRLQRWIFETEHPMHRDAFGEPVILGHWYSLIVAELTEEPDSTRDFSYKRPCPKVKQLSPPSEPALALPGGRAPTPMVHDLPHGAFVVFFPVPRAPELPPGGIVTPIVAPEYHLAILRDSHWRKWSDRRGFGQEEWPWREPWNRQDAARQGDTESTVAVGRSGEEYLPAEYPTMTPNPTHHDQPGDGRRHCDEICAGILPVIEYSGPSSFTVLRPPQRHCDHLDHHPEKQRVVTSEARSIEHLVEAVSRQFREDYWYAEVPPLELSHQHRRDLAAALHEALRGQPPSELLLAYFSPRASLQCSGAECDEDRPAPPRDGLQIGLYRDFYGVPLQLWEHRYVAVLAVYEVPARYQPRELPPAVSRPSWPFPESRDHPGRGVHHQPPEPLAP